VHARSLAVLTLFGGRVEACNRCSSRRDPAFDLPKLRFLPGCAHYPQDIITILTSGGMTGKSARLQRKKEANTQSINQSITPCMASVSHRITVLLNPLILGGLCLNVFAGGGGWALARLKLVHADRPNRANSGRELVRHCVCLYLRPLIFGHAKTCPAILFS